MLDKIREAVDRFNEASNELVVCDKIIETFTKRYGNADSDRGPGRHIYITDLDLSFAPGIVIKWNEKEPGGARPETVLRMALRRIQFLDKQLPCAENKTILKHLDRAIELEEQRTERRKKQGVHGTMERHF